VSQRVAWRRGAFVRHRLIRRKYKLVEQPQESINDEQDNEQNASPSSGDEAVAEERTRILIAPLRKTSGRISWQIRVRCRA
jgi:hypothetical protein